MDGPTWQAFERQVTELREADGGFAEQQALFYRTVQSTGIGNIYFRHYRTRDGFVSVGCLTPGLNARLRKATGLEDPRRRPGFDPGSPEGFDALQALVREAEDLFRTRTTDAWIEMLRRAGVPCGPFRFPTEVFGDEQVRANEYLAELEHPALGRYETFAPPIRLSGSPARAVRSAPLLDGHTDEVLSELGYAPDEIAALRESGAVGSGPRRQLPTDA